MSLFTGIGAFEKALKNLDIPFNLVNFSEIDKYAVKSYTAIHGVSEELNLGDITKIDTSKLSDIDLITYGFPCQDISLCGKMRGIVKGETRSGLFFEALRIIEDTKPKIAIAENVKNLTSKKFSAQFQIVLASLDKAGYNSYYKILNSKEYGIPQHRERVFIVSIRKDIDQHDFRFPTPVELKLKLRDLLEKQVDDKYFLSENMIKTVLSTGTKNFYYKPEIDLDIARPLTSTMHKMHRAGCDNYVSEEFILTGKKYEINEIDCIRVKNATRKGYIEAYEGDSVDLAYPDSKTRRGRVKNEVSGTLTTSDNMAVVVDKLRIRKLTPKECFRLQGFSDEDFMAAEKVNSNTQLYKQAGNSITVNTIQAIINNLRQYLE